MVDLKKMNLLKKDNNLNLLDSYSIPFPLIKKEKKRNILETKINRLRNLYIFGQGANKFSNTLLQIIKDIFKKLKY